MRHRIRSLLALPAAVLLLACGGNPAAGTPGAEAAPAEMPTAGTAPASTPAATVPAEPSDERVMEPGRRAQD